MPDSTSQPEAVQRAMDRRQLLGGTLCSISGAAAALAVATPAGELIAAPPASLDLARIKGLLAGKEPLTWLFTGDSITHGALHTLGWRSYPEHFAERVRWEMRRMRDVVINTGISGNRTGDLLADFDWRAARFQPHMVSIMLGMNDCGAGEAGRTKFHDDLVELVKRTNAAGAVCLLNTPNTVYVKNSASRQDLPVYAQLVRDVARETGAPLVDHYAYWERERPDQEKLLPWIEDGSIHPGNLGHRAFAHEIFRVLGIFDEQSPTCKLAVE